MFSNLLVSDFTMFLYFGRLQNIQKSSEFIVNAQLKICEFKRILNMLKRKCQKNMNVQQQQR